MHESHGHAPGEHAQPADGTPPRGREPGAIVEGGIMVGTMVGVAALTINPFGSLMSLHASPQQQLAYGGAVYALAIVAAVTPGAGAQAPTGAAQPLSVLTCR
jgi:hypothetical protein